MKRGNDEKHKPPVNQNLSDQSYYWQFSDEKIKKTVENLIIEDVRIAPEDKDKIRIDVSGSEVNLSGIVGHEESKTAAVSDAKALGAVTNVFDNIQVKKNR